jgi:pimeloyl-ACP methyl ester carboxylesterase
MPPRSGTSRVPLVLLPGMDGTPTLFGPLLRHLPAWIEPVTVTYPAGRRNGYDDLLPLVRDAVATRKHCHVLGWSLSGPLALRVANVEPERVCSVTLVASFVLPPLRLLAIAGPMLVTPLVGVVRTLRRLPIWLGRPPDDPLRRDKAKLWQTVRASTLAARARAICSLDARTDLVACRQPLLYVASRNDRVVPRHNVERIQRLRPDVEVATIDGGHFSLYGEAQQGADRIADFVQRHDAPATKTAVS